MIKEIINNARLIATGGKLFFFEQKVYIVEAWESSNMTCPQFCRQFGLMVSQLYYRRKDTKRAALMNIKNGGELHSKAEFEALESENDKLKRALCEATLDMKIIKKKLEMD